MNTIFVWPAAHRCATKDCRGLTHERFCAGCAGREAAREIVERVFGRAFGADDNRNKTATQHARKSEVHDA